MDKGNAAVKVSVYSMIINIALSALKLVIGIFASSEALVSDGIHSVSDVFSTIAVIIGIKAASREADRQHRYGHERIECIVGIYLSAILGMVGLGIGYKGVMQLVSGDVIASPGKIALYVALISIATKEIMYQVSVRVGKKVGSTALIADAWHHRSDALSSIGSFIGILGARMGYGFMDPAASIIICIMILKAAYDIGMESSEKLVDKSCPEEEEKQMINAISQVPGVFQVKDLKTRIFANMKYVDIVMFVDGNLSVYEGHKVAMNVHDLVENTFENVKHCMVHVDPIFTEDKGKN